MPLHLVLWIVAVGCWLLAGLVALKRGQALPGVALAAHMAWMFAAGFLWAPLPGEALAARVFLVLDLALLAQYLRHAPVAGRPALERFAIAFALAYPAVLLAAIQLHDPSGLSLLFAVNLVVSAATVRQLFITDGASSVAAFARLVGNWAASLAYCSTHLDAGVAMLACLAVFVLDVFYLFGTQRRHEAPAGLQPAPVV